MLSDLSQCRLRGSQIPYRRLTPLSTSEQPAKSDRKALAQLAVAQGDLRGVLPLFLQKLLPPLLSLVCRFNHRLTDIFEKNMDRNIAEDPATTSLPAIGLYRSRMMAWTTEQKISMISCFYEGCHTQTHTFTYDPEVRWAGSSNA